MISNLGEAKKMKKQNFKPSEEEEIIVQSGKVAIKYKKEQKKFKVAFYPSISKNSVEFIAKYNTLNEAVASLDTMANYTLFLYKHSLMIDCSNVGMIFKNTPYGWIEVDNDGLAI